VFSQARNSLYGRGGVRRRRPVVAVREVELEDFPEQNTDRPTVQQKMVVAPEELVALFAGPEQATSQRAGRHSDGNRSPLGAEILGETALLFAVLQGAPILRLPRQRHLVKHRLNGFGRPIPEKPRTQPPRGAPRPLATPAVIRRVQIDVECAAHLLIVQHRILRQQRMKQ